MSSAPSTSNSSSMSRLLLIMVLLCGGRLATAAVPERFVALPPELGIKAPARLVFSVEDLAACWNDQTARRCILRAPVRIVDGNWRRAFASTGGVATQSGPLPPLTITSEPCSGDLTGASSGVCLDAPSGTNDTERNKHSQQQLLDLDQLPGLMKVEGGATLTLVNLHLNNVAYWSSYVPTATQPYWVDGVGTGLWPSVQMGPGSKLVVANASVTYTNPSSTACPDYVSRALFTFQQLYGRSNMTSVNSTTTRVVGPVYITVAVRDGMTNDLLGNSTSLYQNVTFTCMEPPPKPATGLSTPALAAAIAVPIAVAAVVAGLLAAWLRKRHKRRATGGPSAHGKDSASVPVVKDLEMGTGPPSRGVHGSIPPAAAAAGRFIRRSSEDARRTSVDQHHGRAAACEGAASMPYSFGGSSLMLSTPSGVTGSSVDLDPVTGASSVVSSLPSANQLAPGHPAAAAGAVAAAAGAAGAAGAGGSTIGSRARAGWQQARRNSRRYTQAAELQLLQELQASMQDDTAQLHDQHQHQQLPGAASTNAGLTAVPSTCITPVPSTGDGRQDSTSTLEPGTPKSSLEMHAAAFQGPASSNTGGSSGTGSAADDTRSNIAALLKARSDVAVLRDLRIGTLLGRGSYGRVYRGRWKATPVAVKIIEHYGVDAEASAGSRRISAGREMLFATSISHPNVVTCYHISTMTITQRSALARSWLDDNKTAEEGEEEQDAELMGNTTGSSPDSDSDDNSSSSEDGGPPDMLETWAILEFCERGSLERAMKLGRLRNKTDGRPDIVGIYKALLDTASGLDYLHSIGVVHGDLKTANVLLKGSTRDARGVTCKITDFGLSKILDTENKTHVSTGTYGTIVYMPKELLLQGRMTMATDIYSFGLMMWELFCGQHCMDNGLSVGQMFYMIAYQDWRPEVPPDCPPGYIDLMTSCWHEDPEQRPTAQQLLRRLQKLYVQTKQQSLASSSRSVPARAAGPADRLSLDTTTSEPAPSVPGSPLRVRLDADAAAAYLTDQQHNSAGTLQQPTPSPQQQQLQQYSPGGVPSSLRSTAWDTAHSSAHHAGSTGSSRMPSSTGTSSDRARASQDSYGTAAEEQEREAEGSYEPYVHAVLHRATSLAAPPRASQTFTPDWQPAAAAAAAAAAAEAFAQQAAADAPAIPAAAAAAAAAVEAFAQQAATESPAMPAVNGSLAQLQPAASVAAGNAPTAAAQEGAAETAAMTQNTLLTQPQDLTQAMAKSPAAAPSAAVLHPPSTVQPAVADPSLYFTLSEAVMRQKGGLVQILPGGAYIDLSAPIQPLAPADDVLAYEDYNTSSSEGMPSDQRLQHLTSSSNAMHSGGLLEGVLSPGEENFFESFADPSALPLQLHHQQQQQVAQPAEPGLSSYPDAAAQQQEQHQHWLEQILQQQVREEQQQQAAEQQQYLSQKQQQDCAPAAGRFWPSYMDPLPLPPGAPPFSVTQEYIATIEWASRPEVQAAASAAAARNLALIREQAVANGTLHLLPSFVRDPWLPSAVQPLQYAPADSPGFDSCMLQFPDPSDPAGHDRRALYLRALDSARTPEETIAATNAIIADVVAVDCADDSCSHSSLADRACLDAVGEPDAAVLVDGSMLLSYGAEGFVTQQNCTYASNVSASNAGAASYHSLVEPVLPEPQQGQQVVPAAAAAGALEGVQPTVVNSAGGGGDGSSSANLHSTGHGYSSNSTVQRSFGTSSSGACGTFSGNLYSPAQWHTLHEEGPRREASVRSSGAAPSQGVRTAPRLDRGEPASLSGPLKSFGQGSQHSSSLPAVPVAPRSTHDSSSSTATAWQRGGAPAGVSGVSAATDGSSTMVVVDSLPLQHGEEGRWGGVPFGPEHADSAATTASAPAGSNAAAAISSGSFAGWAASGTESMNEGRLDAVDEGGWGSGAASGGDT